MNLLHISLGLNYGGLESLILSFSKHLSQIGFNVYAAALDSTGYVFTELKRNYINSFFIDRRPGKFDPKTLWRLIKIIKDNNIHIVHSHSGTLMYSALAARICRVPKIVHTEHGRYLPDSIGIILEDRIFSKFITHYVSVSEDLESYLLSVVKIPKFKSKLIINGVDTSSYYPLPNSNKQSYRRYISIGKDDFVVGTISRLVPEKNISFIIDWVSTYGKDYRNLKVLIIGDGPEFENIKTQLFSKAIDCIFMLGRRDDINNLLNIFDIFVLPSKTEGTSLTILEAMACGVPVIASNVGGNSKIITNNINGFLFDFNNLKQFNQYVKLLYTNREKAIDMANSARIEASSKFSYTTMFNEYLKLYQF